MTPRLLQRRGRESHPQLMLSLYFAAQEVCPLRAILQLGGLDHVRVAGAEREGPMLPDPGQVAAHEQLEQNCSHCPHVIGLVPHGLHVSSQKLQKLGGRVTGSEAVVQALLCTACMEARSVGQAVK